MRRESRRRNREDNNLKTILYIGGSVLGIAIIAFAIVFFIYGNNISNQESGLDIATLTQNMSNATNSTIVSTQIGKTVEESANEAIQVQNTITNTTVETNKKDDKKINNTETDVKKETTNTGKVTKEKVEKKEVTFIKPVEGEIYKEFAKDSLIYSETLDEWTTHLGIDIKADKTTVVKASADGRVKSIKTDPRYGLSVIIEHQDGYQTLYANLLTAEFVKVGEEVKQGTTIGTVGNTAAFEVADSAHLHFELSQNGENVDPANFIK